MSENEDICGLCGEAYADKIAHPILWPGEARSDTGLVHASCEFSEQHRAFMALTPEQRTEFLRAIIG